MGRGGEGEWCGFLSFLRRARVSGSGGSRFLGRWRLSGGLRRGGARRGGRWHERWNSFKVSRSAYLSTSAKFSSVGKGEGSPDAPVKTLYVRGQG